MSQDLNTIIQKIQFGVLVIDLKDSNLENIIQSRVLLKIWHGLKIIG